MYISNINLTYTEITIYFNKLIFVAQCYERFKETVWKSRFSDENEGVEYSDILVSYKMQTQSQERKSQKWLGF